MDYIKMFNDEKKEYIRKMNQDPESERIRNEFINHVGKYKYDYFYTWMGRPIIQLPQDIIALQEAIYQVKPDLIIETGIAHGGGTVFYASMLELLGDLGGVEREVVAIDIELREHNRAQIDKHPMRKRITLLDGSSTSPVIISAVSQIVSRHKTIMVVLDSLHTHEHVYNELNAYAPFVTIGSYIVVLDTLIEFTNIPGLPERPWSKGNNPYTAAKQWMSENDSFICDETYSTKLLVTSNPEGWLLRVK